MRVGVQGEGEGGSEGEGKGEIALPYGDLWVGVGIVYVLAHVGESGEEEAVIEATGRGCRRAAACC